MAARTTVYTDNAEHDRWWKLCRVAENLAQRYGKYALVVRHGERWLTHPRTVRDYEIVVTWSPEGASVLRQHLGLGFNRVFAAAPRAKGWAFAPVEIPEPRGRGAGA